MKGRKRLNATTIARRAAPPVEVDEYTDEPQTKLSSAFVVVLILHVVAVGGIYAFQGIKAHRKGQPEVVNADGANAGASNVAPQNPGTTPTAPEVAPTVAATARPPAAENNSQSAFLARHSAPAASPAAAPPAVAPVSGLHVHKVKAGETLAKIAALYSVKTADIEEVNGAKNVATLRAGQILNIPKAKANGATAKEDAGKKPEDAPKVAATAAKAAPKTYVVAKGDNPMAIARKFGVSYDELLKTNNIEDPKKLQIGQTLKIPAKKN